MWTVRQFLIELYHNFRRSWLIPNVFKSYSLKTVTKANPWIYSHSYRLHPKPFTHARVMVPGLAGKTTRHSQHYHEILLTITISQHRWFCNRHYCYIEYNMNFTYLYHEICLKWIRKYSPKKGKSWNPNRTSFIHSVMKSFQFHRVYIQLSWSTVDQTLNLFDTNSNIDTYSMSICQCQTAVN